MSDYKNYGGEMVGIIYEMSKTLKRKIISIVSFMLIVNLITYTVKTSQCTSELHSVQVNMQKI